MKQWLKFKPCDTLFLRGAEALVAGAHAYNSVLFPPSASVLIGACVTASLVQNNKSFKEAQPYNGTFQGPFLSMGDRIFVPMPATWYQTDNGAYVKAKPIDNALTNSLGIKSSQPITHWASADSDLKQQNAWIDLNSLHQTDVVPLNETSYFVEERTGITLERNRSVKEGHLYSARHIRFNPQLELIWGIDDLNLQAKGVLTVGGEQRFGSYFVLPKEPNIPQKGDQFLAAGPILCNEESQKNLIASGKIIYRGGWDLKKQFYKPMLPYYPAGSVFLTNQENNCIPF